MVSPTRLLTRALLAQLLGWLALFIAAQLGVDAGAATGLLIGLVAAACAAALRLPRWWWLIQLGFPLAVQATLALRLPAWPFALALLLCLLLFGAVFSSRVPLWLSGRRVQRSLIARLPAQTRCVVDLGAGTGGIVLALARARPEARVLGIEWALLPWLIGRLRLALAGYRGGWRWGSLWDADLSGVDLAYAYLSPAAMPRLWDKACAEMPRGSLLVSYRFAIPGAPADMIWPVEGQRDADDVLHVWRLPGAQTAG